MHIGSTSRSRRLGLRAGLALIAAGLLLAACGGDDDDDDEAIADTASTTESTAAASGPQELVGLFKVDPGTCADAGVTAGSYFRMAQAGGTVEDGPFVPNGDSTCGDTTWNLLLPGTDGGLRTGAYQPHPDPIFDAAGNAGASAIVMPVKFFAVDFGVATSETDSEAMPTMSVEDGTLTGDLSAFAAAWNNQQFNQGSPKPDGSMPGATAAVSGTFDDATKRFTLDWSSQIVGGPFNDFTGIWHLEGTFEAS
jgi:hypothetical protein